MDVLDCIDYLAQRGELTITCSSVEFASDDLGVHLHLSAWDRRSYEQALTECVAKTQAVSPAST